jgi:TolB-like protein
MDRFTLNLFGTFRLVRADGIEIRIRSAKGRALLALLATSPDGTRERKALREMLWQRSSRAQQQSSLSAELSSLKRTLRRHGATELLNQDSQRVGLARDLIDMDWPAHENASWPGHILSEALFLDGLDLPGCSRWDAWVDAERKRLRTHLAERMPEARATDQAYSASVPSAGAVIAASNLPRPPKPSVAVLPFATVAPDDRWLGFALANDLDIRLSRFPQLFVAGSSSAAWMANMGLLPHEIAERLGVHYTIDRLIVRRGDKIRISVNLIDSDSREQICGDVFLAVADGSGALEQEIADSIAPRIWSKVDISERQQGLRTLGIGSTLYERWWQASARFRSFDRAGVTEAAAMANQLADEHGNCPYCNALAAFLNGLGHLLGITPDDGVAQRRAHKQCLAALRYGPENVEALGYGAGAQLVIGGDMELADRMIDRALAILPSYQPTLFWGGWIDIVSGRTKRARERLELALRINPVTGVRGPTLCAIGCAMLLDGEVEEAFGILAEAQACDPAFPLTYPGLLAAASALGREEEAAALRELLKGSAQLRFVDLFQLPAHREIFARVLDMAH